MSSFNKNGINTRVVENMDIQTLQNLLLRDLELDGDLLDDELRTVALRTLSLKQTESGEVHPDAEASLEKFRTKHPECFAAVSKASFCTRHKRLMRVHNVENSPSVHLAALGSGSASPAETGIVHITMTAKMTNDTEWFAGGMCWLSDGESGRNMTVGCQIVYDKTVKLGIPKNGVAPERYVRNGITHYIMPNAGYYEVVWVNGNVQCSIGAQVSHDEMIKIIDSVYGDVK